MKTINLTTTPESRFIIFSDAHRGDGTGSDDFAANSQIFKCALDYYLAEGFTLIELGDAEELWEVERFQQIYITHASIYERLAAFHDSDPEKTRYIKIWGNHDLYWKDNEAKLHGIFPGIVVYEAALLDGLILMLHGHQADNSVSSVFASAAKFVIGKLWTFAQRMGAKDPTRAANNPGRCDKIDETLTFIIRGGSVLPLSLINSTSIRKCKKEVFVCPRVQRSVCGSMRTSKGTLKPCCGSWGCQHRKLLRYS